VQAPQVHGVSPASAALVILPAPTDRKAHQRAAQVAHPGISSRHIELFLAFTSRTRRQLANMLRGEHALGDGFAYRYTSLREFPLEGRTK
jgi:hypothetical protein